MELEKVKEIITDILGAASDQIFMDSSFVDDLNADSLDVYQILAEVEDEFDIEITDSEVEQIVTVGDVVALIKKVTES